MDSLKLNTINNGFYLKDSDRINSIQFNSILYSDCQIHFSASTKHVIKGHQTITNYTLNLGGFDSANWPTRM